MQNILKNYGLKVTPARQDILSIFSDGKGLKTAEDIYNNLNKKYDLATIYRNLDTFTSKGILFKENLNKKDFYYLAKSHHHHVICRGCEKINCIPCNHKKFSIKDFSHIEHQLVLTGLCKACGNN